MAASELRLLTGVESGHLLDTQQASPVEVVDAHLSRMADVDPAVRAYYRAGRVELAPDPAREQVQPCT